tara:strand:- start:20921 stop:21997 length:1077 start_codon:yes stop_codon:yes gene_type:complete
LKRVGLERRKFLAGAGLAWLNSLTPVGAEKLLASEVLFASAYRDQHGNFGVAILDQAAAIVSTHILPARGHGFAVNPRAQWLVAFARRPGNFAVAMHRRQATEPVVFHTPEDRHFYGHGVYSTDGRLLYAAENAFATGEGIIGIYDASAGFRRISEFPSYGIGPHEIVLMPDGKTLCVANGGIRTHPDQGRQKLNLPTMAPSIALIETKSGTLLSSHTLTPDLHRLSLRHMAVDAAHQVWIGGQYEGDILDDVPVLARLDQDRGLVAVELEKRAATALGKYAGSVAIGNAGGTLAVSSPRSGVIVQLDTKTGKAVNLEFYPGTCGVQALRNGFVSSSETGRFGEGTHAYSWDNHIVRT